MDLYTVYHLNLGFSSIPSDHYPLIVDRCYWPLLEWAKKGYRFGIELPVETARIVKKIDPTWIQTFKDLQEEKKVELVGSGIVQAIFPLIPAEVNEWNLKLGMGGYQDLFSVTPKVAYLHEQTYSASLVRLYQEAGYEGIIFDWNNAPRAVAQNPNLGFKSPWVRGLQNEKVRMVWNSSVAFQYVQRYLHGDLDLAEYMTYLGSQKKKGTGGAFCFYGSDFEMLDYRPGRADALYGLLEERKEKFRFEGLLEEINKSGDFHWILPSEAMSRHAVDQEISLETPEAPIPTKKQETYNVTRWALGGRQNPKLNTLCYRAYELLKSVEKDVPENALPLLWERLCLSWASDYRTYTTEEKFLESQIRIGGLFEEISRYSGISEDSRGELRALAEPPKKAKKTQRLDSSPIALTESLVILKNQFSELVLNKKRGTIKELKFYQAGDQALIGLVPQGTYTNIAHTVDYYSGHCIVERPGSFRYTDRDDTVLISHHATDEGHEVVFRHNSPMMTLWKKYVLKTDEPSVKVQYHFHFKDLPTARIRIGILTALPSSFDKSSLWYGTHNGGRDLEKFKLKDSPAFDAGDPLGFAVSSSYCLGSTAGVIQFGDATKGIQIETNKSAQYTVPLISYVPFEDTYLFRLSHSLGEWDDTANTLWRGHTHVDLKISAI